MATLTSAPVTCDGNITFSGGVEGLIIPIREKDEAGNWIDISTLERFFTIANGTFRKELELDPNNAEGRLLVLTPTELEIASSPQSFAYVDEDNAVPIVLWEGIIYERNLI